MTKLKYENQGGRGFRTFHPFANLEKQKTNKNDKKLTKTELLLKDIKKNSKMRDSRWNINDISYKKVKIGLAIGILLSVVIHKKTGIYPILKKMQKDDSLFKRVKNDIESNYAHISSSALKITVELNKDEYK